ATLRHPYPREELSDALTRFALEGPRQVADTLMQEATERRDGWSKLHELSAIAALRAGRCEEAVRQFILLLEFGIERDDGPPLVDGLAARHQVGQRLALPLQQVELALSLGTLRLAFDHFDLVLEPSECPRVDIAAHRMRRPRQVLGAFQQPVDRGDHVGKQLSLGLRHYLHDLHDA